jgi:hypothetical protein
VRAKLAYDATAAEMSREKLSTERSLIVINHGMNIALFGTQPDAEALPALFLVRTEGGSDRT